VYGLSLVVPVESHDHRLRKFWEVSLVFIAAVESHPDVHDALLLFLLCDQSTNLNLSMTILANIISFIVLGVQAVCVITFAVGRDLSFDMEGNLRLLRHRDRAKAMDEEKFEVGHSSEIAADPSSCIVIVESRDFEDK